MEALNGESRKKTIIVKLSKVAGNKIGKSELDSMIKEVSELFQLTDQAEKLVSKAFNHIVEAERRVHGLDEETDPHFHELATVDTIFDIVGFAHLLNELHFPN